MRNQAKTDAIPTLGNEGARVHLVLAPIQRTVPRLGPLALAGGSITAS